MPYRQPFPIPNDIDPPRKCLCIEIPWTPDHKQVVAGLFWELTQWFNWQRDAEKSGTRLAAVYRSVFNSIDWSDMSCCCNQTTPVLTRVDPETGYVTQISYDGGTTWITNPNSPSLTAPEMPPPVTAGVSATKCDAASNGLQHIKDLVSEQSSKMAGDISITEAAIAIGIFIIGLILAAFTEGAALPAIVPVIVGVMSTIFALGKVAFDAYWTSDVYDKILCALYCNIDSTGQFSDAKASAAIGRIASDLPASPARDWLVQILHVMGTRGLNNICAYGSSSDADCSSCNCNPCPNDWTIQGEGHGTFIGSGDDDVGHYDEYQSTDPGNGNTYIIIATDADNNCCQLFDAIAQTDVPGSFIWGWDVCGETFTVGAPHHVGLKPSGQCLRGFQMQGGSSTPFTMRVYWIPCEG